MDIQPFKITFWDALEASEPGDEEDPSGFFEGLRGVELAYELFYHAYGRFTNTAWEIRLGEVTFSFDINDIFFIWDELPEILTACMNPSDDTFPSTFRFEEQGTELYLIASRCDDMTIYVTPEEMFGGTKCDAVPVDKKAFIGEWRRFAEFLINLFVELGYIAADDPAIAEYYGRMPSVS